MCLQWLMFTMLILIEQNWYEVNAKCVSVADDIDVDPTATKRRTTPYPGEICPKHCTCTKHRVTCVDKGLRTVPDNLPSDVSMLKLSGNFIENLTAYDFRGCIHLYDLHIPNNRIKRIESDTFSSAPVLNNIVLRMNLLRYTSLPTDAFAGLTKLEYLDLSANRGNESEHYNGQLFANLTSLLYLALDGIRGIRFPSELSRLKKLKQLHIYGGYDKITNDTFANLANCSVTTLDILAPHTLRELEPLSFSYFTQLTKLTLGANRLLGLKNASRAWYGLQFTQITVLQLTGITPEDEDSVVLDTSFFDFLELTKIQRLFIDKNRISRIAPQFSTSLPYLQKLKVGDNRLNSGILLLINDLAKLTELRRISAERQQPSSTPFKLSSFWRAEQTIRAIDYERLDTFEQNVNKQRPPIGPCKTPQEIKPCPQTNAGLFSGEDYSTTGVDDVARRFIRHTVPICMAIPPQLMTVTLDEAITVDSYTLSQVFITGGRNLTSLSLAVNGLQRIVGPIYFMEPVQNVSIDLTDNQINCFAPHLFRMSVTNGSYIGDLNLAGNRLADQLSSDKRGEIFQHYELLSVLNLSRNAIKGLQPRAFEKLSRLKILDLSSNSLRVIEFQFHHMIHLKYLDLSYNLIAAINHGHRDSFSAMFKANGSKLRLNLNGNPLQCSCQTLSFLHWLESNKQHMDSFSTYTCLYPNEYIPFSRLSNYILVDLDHECSTRTAAIVAGSFLGLVLCLVTASACCYRHRWEIRYACLKWTRHGQRYQQIIDRPVHYDYDAFVIYDSEDRHWVNDHLVPHLEDSLVDELNNDREPRVDTSPRERNNQLRLCVHERDFPPGHEIIGNIWSKMERSRKVILVISRNFTQSYYCDYEMNLARMQSVEQGRNLIVPILLELPEVDKVSDCLHWVLRKLTYLEWPQQIGEQDEFWQKLQLALCVDSDSGDSLFSHRAVN